MTAGPSGNLLSVSDQLLSSVTGLAVPVPPGTAAALNDSVAAANVLSHLELAMYVAQTCWESNFYRTFVESPVSAAAYEGRADLGNTEPGDGVNFRGRGAIQLTGRFNYSRMATWLAAIVAEVADYDVVSTPELVGTPPYRFLAAAFYWQDHPLLGQAADDGDVVKATRIINGGLNGLYQRQQIYARATAAIG
jgi:putative chitinase